MAFKGSDKWLTQYENCERLAQDIVERIEERDRDNKGFSEANVKIRPLLKKLDGDLKELKEALIKNVSTSQVTTLEGDRRQRLLDTLVSQSAQLEASLIRKHARQDFPGRTNLLGGELPQSRAGASAWSDDSSGIPEDFSVDDAKRQHQITLEQQDAGLEVLSSVIARQKQLAYAIGDEADLHNELIDDITDHVDRTRDRLIRETRHVQIVDRKSGTCWYWVFILLLLVAIIIIVAVPFKK